MERFERRGPAAKPIVWVLLAVAVLYVGREVLLPFALAVLLSFLLSPLASRLERLRIGRVGSVLVTVALAFGAIGLTGWLIADQTYELAQRLPEYKDTLITRIQSVRSQFGGPSPLSEVVEEIGEAVEGTEAKADAGRPAAEKEPVLVRVAENSPLALRLLRDWLGPLLSPLGTAAVVIVFVIFILLQREDLRDRFIRLVGTGRVYMTTQALDDAAARVTKYLLMLLIVNFSYGLAVGIGLYFIGLPNAPLWGLLAAVFRFVPYVGPWAAAALPIALSFASSGGWTMPALTIGWFVVLELISNNVIEPWLYGSKTGVSVVGIIFAATFWTWLWGPIGLMLAMPLTVCLTVLGRYVPQLSFFNILLSDEPALELHVRYYQRLLTFSDHDANDLVAAFLKSGSLEELYEKMLIPALSYSEQDRQADRLTENQSEFIHRTVLDSVNEQGREFDMSAAGRALPEGAAEDAGPRGATQERPRHSLQVACAAAADEADHIAGEMLAQLLTARGHAASSFREGLLDEEFLQRLQAKPWAVLVISALAPGGASRARRGAERLRKNFPNLKIVVGLWNAGGPLEQTKQRLAAAKIDFVTTSLHEAIVYLEELAQSEDATAAPPKELAAAGANVDTEGGNGSAITR